MIQRTDQDSVGSNTVIQDGGTGGGDLKPESKLHEA